MSYKRSYSETITVRGTKSVSYPKSETGGTMSVSYVESVPVNINIDVDTLVFDKSVKNCNTNVNLLTGSVVATESAQIASIHKNSEKVAGTIVNGFFGFIRSEISQQVAELQQNIDATVVHLRELATSCVAKKRQMESDFYRISERYLKIFDDLNRETFNRIADLDRSAFGFSNQMIAQRSRSIDNDLVNTVAVFGKEGGSLQSQISASVAKKRAMDALSKARNFLFQQQKMNDTIQNSIENENKEAKYFSPVCFAETSGQTLQKNVFTDVQIPAVNTEEAKNRLMHHFSDVGRVWKDSETQEIQNLQNYFHSTVENAYSGQNDAHSERIRKTIYQIADLKNIKVLNTK